MKNYLNVLTLAALTALFLSGCAGQQQGKGLADISADVAAVELDADANGGVDIGKGGTNATTAGAARTNLGVGTGDNPSFNSVHASGGNMAANNAQVTKKWITGLQYTADVTSVLHGGKHFICTSTHTAGSTTEPDVGVSWETVWKVDGDGIYAPALGADDNYVTDAEKTVIGNTSGTNTGDQTSVSGNAGTATALAANGTNCSSGQAPLGMDASGNAEGCWTPSSGSMTWPSSVGVANYSGSSTWGTSYTVGTGANNLVQLNASSQLPAVSAALLTNFPTLNQNTTGTAGGLSGTPNIIVGTLSAGAGGFSVGADGATTAKSITIPGATAGPQVVLLAEDSDNGSTQVGIAAPASTTQELVLILPTANPTAGQSLVCAVPSSVTFSDGVARNASVCSWSSKQDSDADLTTWAGVTPGTGVATALAVNVGSAGAPVIFNGAGGTPSSLTLTNATLANSTSLPGTCTLGQLYIDTDADSDGELYICRATNTWKAVDDDGGAGGLATTDIDTSSELRTIVTDESGTGALLFAGGDVGASTATTASSDDNDTSVATTAFVQTELTGYAADSATLTNKTLSVEGTGNAITIVDKVWFAAAGCNNTTATSFYDLPTSNPAAAACITGTNTQKGVLDFDAATDESGQVSLALPSDWSGNIDLKYKWLAAATSGSVVWGVQTSCVADAETDDPSWNTASTVTDAAKGTTLQTNDASMTSITVTGCAAGELMHLRFFRDADNGSDGMTGDARLIGAELTLRRAQ